MVNIHTEFLSFLSGILKGADLSSLSAKKVRLKLQEKLGIDLSERYIFIGLLTQSIAQN